MYVIAAPVVPAGSSILHNVRPVDLARALNPLPPQPGEISGGMPGGRRGPLFAIAGEPSPMNSKVLVTSGAARPGLPSGGRFNCLIAGLFLGPSPFATIHRCSPRLRSMAVIRP